DVAGFSERAALASERTEANVEGLRREFRAFTEGRLPEAAFSEFVDVLTAGVLSAFDGSRLLEERLHEAGYDLKVGTEGLRIRGEVWGTQGLPPVRIEALKRAATRLRQALAGRQPSDAELDALADRYRQHLIHWFQSLTFQGLTPSVHAIVLRLEEIYVEL